MKEKFFLVIKKGNTVLRTSPVYKETFLIGRHPECDIVLDDPSISRRHCRIQKDGDWVIQDMNSKNGTFLLGKRIQNSSFQPDDEIQIGIYTIMITRGKHLIDDHTQELNVDREKSLLGDLEDNDSLPLRIKAFLEEEKSRREVLKNQVYRDPLTGLYNRRFFEDEIKKQNVRFCVFFVDIDDFKLFNDKWGHSTGDLLLEGLGEFLIRELKKGYCVRWGGEEFVIFIPHIDTEEGVKRAHDIVKNFERISIEKFGLRVTLSIGIAFLHRDGDSLEAVIEKADIAMFEAKKRGKNQVSLFEG